MLKIKDNVDLKELEKFGFEKRYLGDNNFEYTFFPNGFSVTTIKVDREIVVCPFMFEIEYTQFLDKFFDLIQAGLVEKIE